MGGSNSRVRLTNFLRRSERDRSDTEEDEEGWSMQPDEDDTSEDENFDSGNVQNMLRYLLRYRLMSRYLKPHEAYPISLLWHIKECLLLVNHRYYRLRTESIVSMLE